MSDSIDNEPQFVLDEALPLQFDIDGDPPALDEINEERTRLAAEMKRVKFRDNALTAVLILASTIIVSLAVYWTTRSLRYAALAASIFPIVGTVFSVIGITTAAGFRSAAKQVIELNQSLIELNPVSDSSKADIEKLRSKYEKIETYCRKTDALERECVNGELALFWEWDASTMAKQDKQKDFVERARDGVAAS